MAKATYRQGGSPSDDGFASASTTAVRSTLRFVGSRGRLSRSLLTLILATPRRTSSPTTMGQAAPETRPPTLRQITARMRLWLCASKVANRGPSEQSMKKASMAWLPADLRGCFSPKLCGPRGVSFVLSKAFWGGNEDLRTRIWINQREPIVISFRRTTNEKKQDPKHCHCRREWTW